MGEGDRKASSTEDGVLVGRGGGERKGREGRGEANGEGE